MLKKIIMQYYTLKKTYFFSNLLLKKSLLTDPINDILKDNRRFENEFKTFN